MGHGLPVLSSQDNGGPWANGAFDTPLRVNRKRGLVDRPMRPC